MPLTQQVVAMRGPAFNLSIIFVGHRPDFSGTFSTADATEVTFAVQRTREIYSQVGLGIRRLYWTYISEDDVGGYTAIANYAEAEDLTEDWSGTNDGLDLFFVQTITGAAGWSDVGGSCNKSGKGMTGSVCELNPSSAAFVGVLVAHELGHYLGLGSGTSSTNVMGTDADGDGIDSISTASINLTTSQGDTMKNHCSVNPAV